MNPENQTNPETSPTPSTEINANTPLSITPQQPNGPLPPRPKKSKLAKWIIGIVIFLAIAAPIAYIAIPLSILANHNTQKLKNLKAHALVLEEELNSLVITDNQSLKSVGYVNGDGFTANDDPNVSTYAQAELEVSKSLSVIETEVNANLVKAGYTREGEPEKPYYATSPDAYNYSSIALRYTKGERAIKVSYELDKSYGCPKGNICKFTPKNTLPGTNYPLSGFADIPVTHLTVTLGGKTYNYMTAF